MVPMDIKTVFASFFEDDAPYSFDRILDDLAYVLIKRGKWTKSPVEEIDGYKVIAERRAEYNYNERTNYLLK